MQQDLEGVSDRMVQQAFLYRTREQVARFFEGTDLVDLGLVQVEQWRPDPGADDTARSLLWCAVGKKR